MPITRPASASKTAARACASVPSATGWPPSWRGGWRSDAPRAPRRVCSSERQEALQPFELALLLVQPAIGDGLNRVKLALDALFAQQHLFVVVGKQPLVPLKQTRGGRLGALAVGRQRV